MAASEFPLHQDHAPYLYLAILYLISLVLLFIPSTLYYQAILLIMHKFISENVEI